MPERFKVVCINSMQGAIQVLGFKCRMKQTKALPILFILKHK